MMSKMNLVFLQLPDHGMYVITEPLFRHMLLLTATSMLLNSRRTLPQMHKVSHLDDRSQVKLIWKQVVGNPLMVVAVLFFETCNIWYRRYRY